MPGVYTVQKIYRRSVNLSSRSNNKSKFLGDETTWRFNPKDSCSAKVVRELYTTRRSTLMYPLVRRSAGKGIKRHSDTFLAGCSISSEHFSTCGAKDFRAWFPRKMTALKHATATQVQCPCSHWREHECTEICSVWFLLPCNSKGHLFI